MKDNTATSLRTAREKILAVIIDMAGNARSAKLKQKVVTPADVFARCLKAKVFTSDELSALQKVYPAVSDTGQAQGGPSPLCARTVLDELANEGRVRVRTLTYGSFTVNGFEIIGLTK